MFTAINSMIEIILFFCMCQITFKTFRSSAHVFYSGYLNETMAFKHNIFSSIYLIFLD